MFCVKKECNYKYFEKIADYVILVHRGRIIFEEQKGIPSYSWGIVKCGKGKFGAKCDELCWYAPDGAADRVAAGSFIQTSSGS